MRGAARQRPELTAGQESGYCVSGGVLCRSCAGLVHMKPDGSRARCNVRTQLSPSPYRLARGGCPHAGGNPQSTVPPCDRRRGLACPSPIPNRGWQSRPHRRPSGILDQSVSGDPVSGPLPHCRSAVVGKNRNIKRHLKQGSATLCLCWPMMTRLSQSGKWPPAVFASPRLALASACRNISNQHVAPPPPPFCPQLLCRSRVCQIMPCALSLSLFPPSPASASQPRCLGSEDKLGPQRCARRIRMWCLYIGRVHACCMRLKHTRAPDVMARGPIYRKSFLVSCFPVPSLRRHVGIRGETRSGNNNASHPSVCSPTLQRQTDGVHRAPALVVYVRSSTTIHISPVPCLGW
ncbi:hypothetical protein F4802DRAFT_210017 [Xylaria palmicola]|nr:hypothetical protein F4802DRAFT_210017 [Xylaria palmicola]